MSVSRTSSTSSRASSRAVGWMADWLVGWLAAGCWLLLAAGCWLLLLLLLLPAAFCCLLLVLCVSQFLNAQFAPRTLAFAWCRSRPRPSRPEPAAITPRNLGGPPPRSSRCKSSRPCRCAILLGCSSPPSSASMLPISASHCVPNLGSVLVIAARKLFRRILILLNDRFVLSRERTDRG